MSLTGYAVAMATSDIDVFNNLRYIQSCESNFDNSLRSSARDTKIRTITCNYLYKLENFKKKYILMSISFVVSLSRRSSCILFK